MTILRALSYCFNPFEPSQHALEELKRMPLPRIFFVLFSTAIATILTLGLGTIGAFRFLAHTFSVQAPTPGTKKIGKVAQSLSPQVSAVAPQTMQKTGPSPKILEIKKLHTEYLAKFEKRAQSGKWREIREDHFDWWMFPIMRPSRGHGERFALSKEEIDFLKRDSAFMDEYRRGVKLVIESWGWDLEKGGWARPSEWDNWTVRFVKIAESLNLFGEDDLFRRVKEFARALPIARSNPDYKWFNQLGILP